MSEALTIDELLASRKAFFDRMLALIAMPPHQVDVRFGQDKYYCLPEMDSVYVNLDLGTLLIDVKPEIDGVKTHFCYSIFHYGEYLKIGIILFDTRLESAPQLDMDQEWGKLWGDQPVDVIWREDTTIYEWCFDLVGKNFHRNMEAQERFTIGLRHIHFRLMRMFHDAIEEHRKIGNTI